MAAEQPALHFLYEQISALNGDNVVTWSPKMPWYHGESVLDHLESVYVGSDRNLIDLRFPVQYVIRPHQDFRGYAGQIASGVLKKGEEVLLRDREGNSYRYRVSEVMEVEPNDVWVMGQVRGRDMVTLQTCTPIPTFEKRLVVRADRI